MRFSTKIIYITKFLFIYLGNSQPPQVILFPNQNFACEEDLLLLWCCKLVWAQMQGPLGTVPRGLGFVPRWLRSVPRGLDFCNWGSCRSWHIAKLGMAHPKSMTNRKTTSTHSSTTRKKPPGWFLMFRPQPLLAWTVLILRSKQIRSVCFNLF